MEVTSKLGFRILSVLRAHGSNFRASGGLAINVSDDLFKEVGKDYIRLIDETTENGHGISYAKEAKKVATAYKVTKWAGRGVGLYNSLGVAENYWNGKISDSQFVMEQTSNAISTYGGLYGAAWGFGWEVGRFITSVEAYQEWKYNTWLPLREQVLHY